MRNKVTLIGTLPPIKGSSLYCLGLLSPISKRVNIEFIGFKRLYPNFLYPGGTKVKDDNYKIPQIENARIRNILTYYNPFSWIWAGLTAKGDIIHAQWWSHILAPVYLVILLICKMRRKKILITVHNVFPHEASKLNNFLNRIILRFGDAFIVHNERSKETLSSVYKILRGKIFIVPHGVLQPVAGKRIKETARNYLKIPQDKRVILYFGNIREYKGVDILLKSLRLIKEEMKEVVLLIAGEPWVDWEIYEKIIREDGLEDLVIKRLNFVLPSEIEYYFSASDTVVLPYKYFDSQSGIGALALAFKKPLVVTDVGGLPDFVKDERAIAKPKDAEDLARVITRVLSDEQLLAKLSQDSEGLAEEYGWDGIAQKTTKLYEELLA